MYFKRIKWIFTKEHLSNNPSRKDGISIEKDVLYRQQSAALVQDMGQRLKMSQLCINSAIVYLQRFYMFHSFKTFHRYAIAAASLFLSGKLQEQPRRLEHVIKVANCCINPEEPLLDPLSNNFKRQVQDLIFHENVLLQTLGFDFDIDHSNAHVVHICRSLNASKDLVQTAYFAATSNLHLTTMCLRYPPKLIACVCIQLAFLWFEEQHKTLPVISTNDWYMTALGQSWRKDAESTLQLINMLKEEFLNILKHHPTTFNRLRLARESQKRLAEDETHSEAKKPKQLSSAPDLVNVCVSENKSISNQPINLTDSTLNSSKRPVAIILPTIQNQSTNNITKNARSILSPVADSISHGSKHQLNTHQSSTCAKHLGSPELNIIYEAKFEERLNVDKFLFAGCSQTSTSPEENSKTKAVLDIDTFIPHDQPCFKGRGPTGTAPRITNTPLKQRLFGSTSQSSG